MNFPKKIQKCRFDILTPFSAASLTSKNSERPRQKTKNPAKAGFF
ncbi:MAG: hypothetical protein WAV95_13320 [Azonexus sp.]